MTIYNVCQAERSRSTLSERVRFSTALELTEVIIITLYFSVS